MDQDDEHGSHNPALGKHTFTKPGTKFWGAQGAGCLIGALKTKRILFAFRSADVNEPHTWGTIGGAIDKNLTPEQAVRREVQQEAGIELTAKLIPLFVFESQSFKYFNFLALVTDEFVPRLNWETEAFRWAPLGQWPTPMHFGLKALLRDQASLDKITRALS